MGNRSWSREAGAGLREVARQVVTKRAHDLGERLLVERGSSAPSAGQAAPLQDAAEKERAKALFRDGSDLLRTARVNV